MKKEESEILVAYLKNPSEVKNRKSALGSYVFQLSGVLLNISPNVSVNGDYIKKEKSIEIDKNNNTVKNSRLVKLIPKYFRNIIRDLIYIRNLEILESKLVNQFSSIDKIILIEIYSIYSGLGVRMKKNKKLKYILLYDSPLEEEYLFFNKFNVPFLKRYKRHEKEALFAADNIIVYSPAVKDYLCKRYGNDLNNKFIYHHNVDFSRLHFRKPKRLLLEDKPITIGFVGSFLKWHRVDLLIDCFERLRDYSNIKLLLVGDGVEFEKIEKRVSESMYRNDIQMTGFLDGEDLKKTKESIDIGVMPSSNWYGAPNKLFEYGAMGIACVAPRTPTIEFIFQDDKEVLLFENNNASELEKHIYKLVEDIELRYKLGLNLYNRILNDFNENNTVEFYREKIDGMMDKKVNQDNINIK